MSVFIRLSEVIITECNELKLHKKLSHSDRIAEKLQMTATFTVNFYFVTSSDVSKLCTLQF